MKAHKKIPKKKLSIGWSLYIGVIVLINVVVIAQAIMAIPLTFNNPNFTTPFAVIPPNSWLIVLDLISVLLYRRQYTVYKGAFSKISRSRKITYIILFFITWYASTIIANNPLKMTLDLIGIILLPILLSSFWPRKGHLSKGQYIGLGFIYLMCAFAFITFYYTDYLSFWEQLHQIR